VTHEVVTQIALDQSFEIPPQEPAYEVHTHVELPKNGQLLSIVPHMHLRGKSFRLFVASGERREALLDVPRYDFNWQHIYQLAQPLALSDVDRLDCEVVFDNSPDNPFNPDPSRYVTWGDQTWDEMAVAFFDVSVPLVHEPLSEGEQALASSAEATAAPHDAASDEVVEEFVDEFTARFDSDDDGAVHRDETPRSLRAFGFPQLDSDGDGRLSRDEIRRLARRRLER
jgi:hypothetical protein